MREGAGRAGQESVWRTSSSFTLQSARWKLPLLSKWRCLLRGGQGRKRRKKIKRESYATCRSRGLLVQVCWVWLIRAVVDTSPRMIEWNLALIYTNSIPNWVFLNATCERTSLSLKHTGENPWKRFRDNIECKISLVGCFKLEVIAFIKGINACVIWWSVSLVTDAAGSGASGPCCVCLLDDSLLLIGGVMESCCSCFFWSAKTRTVSFFSL